MTPLTKAAVGGVESISEVLDPTGEWEHMLMVQTEEGAAAIPVAPFFTTDERRDLFAERVLPQMIEDVPIEEVVLVAPVWVGDEIDEGDPVERPTEEKHRTEAVLVTSVTADRIENHIAYVTRSDDGPPTLSEWRGQPMLVAFGATGRIATEAMKALKARA